MSKTKRLPVVEVEWVDSMGHTGWRPRTDVLADCRSDGMGHRSAGYLLERTTKYVVLTLSMGDDVDNVDSSIQIPRSAVRSITTLKAS